MSEMAKNRRKWDCNQMKTAIEEVWAKKCGYLKVNNVYNMPTATLIYYCDKVKNGESLSQLSQAVRKKTILPQ